MKFIVDQMLGKLAKWLRMLGYDTVYYKGEYPKKITELVLVEDRIFLTRNKKINQENLKGRIIRVNENNPYLQLQELISKGILYLHKDGLFSRCLICNKKLENIPREKVKGMVPDYIFLHHKEFQGCPQCNRIYWRGTHLENMRKMIEELFK